MPTKEDLIFDMIKTVDRKIDKLISRDTFWLAVKVGGSLFAVVYALFFFHVGLR